MDKDQLAAQLARRTRLSRPAAADELDQVVHDILETLRKGQPASLPGLGTFVPGATPAFQFELAPAEGGRRRGRK